jgi:RNA polymerase sigma factor (sigma-70 family)
MLEEHRALIERILRFLRRRKHLSAEDFEELSGEVWTRLLTTDCAVLRKAERSANPKAFLTTTLGRWLLDWRNAQWGKWRPSAAAHRAGPVAEHLERYLVREGFTFDEACRVLCDNHAVELSEQELAALAALLPARVSRRPEGEEVLDRLASPDPDPEEQALENELRVDLARVIRTVDEVLVTLIAEDRLIVHLRFREGLAPARIARILDWPVDRLYRRIEWLKKDLPKMLLERGVSRELIRRLLGIGPPGPSRPPEGSD